MKRIFSAIAVIAIVSSALAFAPSKKGGTFCAATTSGGLCQIINGKTEINNGKTSATYYKYNAWDGQSSNCPLTTPSPCTTQVVFYNEL